MNGSDEVTMQEMKNAYKVIDYVREESAWVKHITMVDKDSNTVYTGRLYWDSHDGYDTAWDDAIPPQGMRPEFEYILDSMTEDMKNE